VALHEPVASLDPLARREFLQHLMAATVEHELSVVLSSHLVAELERVCDYLVVLAGSRLQVAGPADDLLATHRRLVAPDVIPSPCPPTRR
jgi:ABC-2 type transport system ATP-binding protein